MGNICAKNRGRKFLGVRFSARKKPLLGGHLANNRGREISVVRFSAQKKPLREDPWEQQRSPRFEGPLKELTSGGFGVENGTGGRREPVQAEIREKSRNRKWPKSIPDGRSRAETWSSAIPGPARSVLDRSRSPTGPFFFRGPREAQEKKIWACGGLLVG